MTSSLRVKFGSSAAREGRHTNKAIQTKTGFMSVAPGVVDLFLLFLGFAGLALLELLDVLLRTVFEGCQTARTADVIGFAPVLDGPSTQTAADDTFRFAVARGERHALLGRPDLVLAEVARLVLRL